MANFVVPIAEVTVNASTVVLALVIIALVLGIIFLAQRI